MIPKLVFLFVWLLICNSSYSQKLEQPFWISARNPGRQHIDLSGIWELSYMDTPVSSITDLQKRKEPFETQVPNSVQWSFYKAGKLPHPYVSLNASGYEWILDKCWYYQREIEIPASAKGNSIILCFDGIDYFSKIWVNEKLVGEHEGMFGGPDADISDIVNYGAKNKITVEVRAANWGNKGFNPRAGGRIIKPWIIAGGSGKKALFSVGMWQGARIEIVPEFHMERPFLITTGITDDEAILHLSLEVLACQTSLDKKLHSWSNSQVHHPDEHGKSFIPVSEKLSVLIEFLSGNKRVFSKQIYPTIYQGTNWLEQDLVLANPKLWSPNGMGTPNLYQVKLTLTKNGVQADHICFDYGIRTVERQATEGPRTADRWENWQFVVNGRKLFVKGMNWTPVDVLLDLPEERYRWVLEAAKNMGIQLIRVWGGGLLETDHFYRICDELGIMVWQDFPIGNQDTPEWAQDIWEAQVVQNIFRLRNHPSLVVWCGGNEFNPYSLGNTASIGIIERNLDIFDKTRFFVRTTPDDGSMHAYPDMDPCWYNRSYKLEPWVSETGMHSMPEADLFYELVDRKEFVDLGKMWEKDFPKTHSEFIHHFDEYSPARVPRMLSRASHIVNLENASIESITEASQVGTGEWYQIVSEKMQGNYPVTNGIMPWVFKRHWPAIAIQMMDWFGQPGAPYYFLKRTYEQTHVALDLQRLLWAAGEPISFTGSITHSGTTALAGKISVTVYDDAFNFLWNNETIVSISEGPSVVRSCLGEYTIPSGYRDRYLFAVTELKNDIGELISRSFYCLRVLVQMEDQAFHEKYVREPIPWITLGQGPWLKPIVSKASTELKAELVGNKVVSNLRSQLKLKLTNTGTKPAFMTKIDVRGVKRIFYANDNYFWLAPGEHREIKIEVQRREAIDGKSTTLEISAWNAEKQSVKL
ncbi:MAG: sugar-binding domain-containing protein [Prolixibacteraceae bacterium]